MAVYGIDHLAIRVPDLRAAEEYYVELFEARVVCREARVAGEWRTLPYEAGWDEAEAAGIGLELSFLSRDGLDLALLSPAEAPGGGDRLLQTLDHVGIRVDLDGLGPLRARARALGCRFEADRPAYLHFEDRYGIEWEARPPIEPGRDPSTGARTGRWITLDQAASARPRPASGE